jgi:hypothetical protein
MPRKAGSPQLAFQCTPEAVERLKALSTKTDIPQSRLLRQALDLLFAKYEDVLQEPKATKARK